MATASTINHGQVTVGATAVKVVSARTLGDGIYVKNTHATNILYLGGSGVTVLDGYPLNAGQSQDFSTFVGDLYGIASGAGTVAAWIGVS